MVIGSLPDRFFIPAKSFEPAYLELGLDALKRRTVEAVAMLADCHVCPRDCAVNRLEDETAACRSGRNARVSAYFPHRGEEDCLRGWHGSGTIFFGYCNLFCQFCQNWETSQEGHGSPQPPARIAEMMLELQALGCHNINFVTPEHVVPQMLEALVIAVEGGLRLPIVYNTSAYDSLHSLHLLDGIVDIYMPDFKVWDETHSLRYLKSKDYPAVARAAIKEMNRQVGPLKFDEQGLAKRGVLVRHLVMPEDIAGTAEIMRFLAEEVSPDTYVNVMAQYYPAGKVSANKYAEINRRITRGEFAEAMASARAAGLRIDERINRMPGLLWRL